MLAHKMILLRFSLQQYSYCRGEAQSRKVCVCVCVCVCVYVCVCVSVCVYVIYFLYYSSI